jgi:hypothetical protein
MLLAHGIAASAVIVAEEGRRKRTREATGEAEP